MREPEPPPRIADQAGATRAIVMRPDGRVEVLRGSRAKRLAILGPLARLAMEFFGASDKEASK